MTLSYPDYRFRTDPRRCVVMNARSTTLVLVVALFSIPTGAAAQGTASLVGVVMDAADLRPLPDAQVTLTALDRGTRADAEGRFTLADVPTGLVALRVEYAGYVTIVESLELFAEEASLFHFQMQRVTALLDSLLVGARGADWRERGHAEGQITIGESDFRTAADLLLTSVPGLTARRPDGAMGTGVNVQLRGVNSFELSSQPHIYMDGVRIDAGGTDGAILVLDQIPASAVKRIRILRGPASSSRYPGAAAGVIVIETTDPS
jgi:TonB-dependent starch-binding outer membrane protein SusC